MSDRMKDFYKAEIKRKKALLSKQRLDDYDIRASIQLDIEELENKVKGNPSLKELLTEELIEERRKLERSASGTAAILFAGKAAYSHEKINRINEVLRNRRKEEKKQQEINSDIFSKSDFVKEDDPPVQADVLNESIVRELSEYTVKALKELYRYGMDYDLIKNVYGSRVIPVLSSSAPEEETYYTFEYYCSGNGVCRVFQGKTEYSAEEFNSIKSESDYKKLVNDTGYHKYLCSITMTVEELSEKFVRRSIIKDYSYIRGKTITPRFRRNISEIYYTRQNGAFALDEMKELIKQYFLGTIKLSNGSY